MTRKMEPTRYLFPSKKNCPKKFLGVPILFFFLVVSLALKFGRFASSSLVKKGKRALTNTKPSKL
jgi:hypothetical protein